MIVGKPQLRMMTGSIRLMQKKEGQPQHKWNKTGQIYFHVAEEKAESVVIQIERPVLRKFVMYRAAQEDRSQFNAALAYFSSPAPKEITKMGFSSYVRSGRPREFDFPVELLFEGPRGEETIYQVTWGITHTNKPQGMGLMYNYFRTADTKLAGTENRFNHF
ncbi:MAG: hypothetical protein HQ564_10400 [Candidatus Saganbacteria bacterium]|nr:hypothetical protein [Candidatus Saganbacteria bacterium]